MKYYFIASNIPGRLRLRRDAWRSLKGNEAACAELAGWEGVTSVRGNWKTGSVLMLYDVRMISQDTMTTRVLGRFGEDEAGRPADTFPPRSFSVPKSWNRYAKIGALGTMAASLAALGFSRRAHAVFGGVSLALAAVHIAANRNKLWR